MPTTLKSIILAMAMAAAVAAPALAGADPAINCDTDRNPAERTICGTYRLLKTDAKIAFIFSELMENPRLPARTYAGILSSQREFLERRNSCGRNIACLDHVMDQRQVFLSSLRYD